MTFFLRWLEDQGRTAALDGLQRPAIREWLAELNERQEPGTVTTRYRGLFRFCGWLVDEQYLVENPMRTLSSPVLKAKPVPVITDQELAALLKAWSGKGFADQRDGLRGLTVLAGTKP